MRTPEALRNDVVTLDAAISKHLARNLARRSRGIVTVVKPLQPGLIAVAAREPVWPFEPVIQG